ncbi:MAG: PPK2 family polyphosphate kinase [Mucilaginibacter sp.]|uniref:PPK2 family polyphosphate kinase n=1 Tax=Mucilaginibacter sp. TaxID=1882438 RepID=UPI00326591B6
MKNINDISTDAPDDIEKSEANKQLKKMRKDIFSLQNLFYADGKRALLIILQGMDSSGKDGTIRHVFSCINPQGCRVKSFKTPTEEEKSHDFLWRVYANLPEKGMIQIFNRSQYEDILFPVVHELIDKKEIQERHKAINEFEAHLQDSHTVILKFFLHISEKEQRHRINKRLNDPEKQWKYNPSDKKEAKLWDNYIAAYQSMLDGCGKKNPWIIVPADQKWYRNYLVAKTIVETLENLKMNYPKKT